MDERQNMKHKAICENSKGDQSNGEKCLQRDNCDN
jgi:hypothetical protein